ncbi:hypothetical protein G7046_g5582 [Stylonectria norvegica]|nr:hypothetical protein G7046_g5582 [Stylonectria norvegica]
MAESSWLRLLSGPRSRTPGQLSSPRSEPALRQHHHSGQGCEEQHGHANRTISRLSSWHGLSKLASGTAPADTTPADTEPESEMAISKHDHVWHNPSLDQMAAALRVTMMTHPLLEPLPVQYHSYILHVIEGYAGVRSKLSKTEKQLVDGEKLRQKETEAFKAMHEDCMIREARYKAEIKRLELIIHKTSAKGLEAVALARRGSLIRGTARGSATTVGKGSNAATEHMPDRNMALPRILDLNNDVRLSRRLRRGPETEESRKAIVVIPETSSPSVSNSSGARHQTASYTRKEGNKPPAQTRPRAPSYGNGRDNHKEGDTGPKQHRPRAAEERPRAGDFRTVDYRPVGGHEGEQVPANGVGGSRGGVDRDLLVVLDVRRRWRPSKSVHRDGMAFNGNATGGEEVTQTGSLAQGPAAHGIRLAASDKTESGNGAEVTSTDETKRRE